MDILSDKVALLNQKKSPIGDREIEDFLAKKLLHLTATTNKQLAYTGEDFVITATPTDYDSETNDFNTKSVEAVIKDEMAINQSAVMVIKSTIPVGYREKVRATLNCPI